MREYKKIIFKICPLGSRYYLLDLFLTYLFLSFSDIIIISSIELRNEIKLQLYWLQFQKVCK